MGIVTTDILSILDSCCESFTFPMLDNGYVYLAATRLSLYRSAADWAIVMEVFGFSPRAGIPDTNISTFGSRLHNRKSPDDYATREAYENYIKHNPHNESSFIFPIAEGEWLSAEDGEVLADGATQILLRDQFVRLPTRVEYSEYGIELETPDAVCVFEVRRFLAAQHRDAVLADADERRSNVPPELEEILVLDEWNHPDVVDDSKRPSGSESFQQLAAVLATGDVGQYRPTQPPNTHWSNWPEGGTL